MRHLILPLLLASNAAAQCSWLPGYTYTASPFNGNIPALLEWQPKSGPALLAVSSSFPQVGAPPVKLGFFDGVNWTTPPAGPGISPAAFCIYQDKLIVGGFAGTVTGPTIATWDGQQWGLLGSGLDGVVRAMVVHNGDLFVGGEFFTAGGIPASKIARWDGEQWHDVGGGVSSTAFPMVLSLASVKGKLIAGGFFAAAGQTPALNIASWDGEQWSSLGAGRPGAVDALAEFQGEIIAAGAAPISRWTGQDWLPLGAGTNQNVRTLTIFKGKLIAGGFFSTAGGQPASLIASWDGANWSGLSSGITMMAFGAGNVTALTVFQNRLSVGGFFDTAGGAPSVNFARWACGGACYPNCDASTVAPVLTANDFQCFLNNFAAAAPYANCDGSTVPPTLTANDFQCFLNAYAAGCP